MPPGGPAVRRVQALGLTAAERLQCKHVIRCWPASYPPSLCFCSFTQSTRSCFVAPPMMQCPTITNCESYSTTDCKCTKCKQYLEPDASGQSCRVGAAASSGSANAARVLGSSGISWACPLPYSGCRRLLLHTLKISAIPSRCRSALRRPTASRQRTTIAGVLHSITATR